MKRTIWIISGLLMMALMVTGYEWATTFYADERQNEEFEAYCSANSIPADGACWQLYLEQAIDGDRNTKVIDNINQLIDFCHDDTKYELCRIFQDNMLEIYTTTAAGTIWLECQDGEPEEWTRTHCPYGLANAQTRCLQSGAGTIYLDCTIAWVLD